MEPPGKGRAEGETELDGLRAHSQDRQEDRAPQGRPLPFPGAGLARLPPSPEVHTLATEPRLGSRSSRHLCPGQQPHCLEPHFPALGPGAAELGMAVTKATLQGVTEALAKNLMSGIFFL